MLDAACEEYNVPHTSQIGLMTNSLEEISFNQYLDRSQGLIYIIRGAYKYLEARLNSPYARAQAQSYLKSITFKAINQTEKCSTAQVLDIAKRTMANVEHIFGPDYRAESHKGL